MGQDQPSNTATRTHLTGSWERREHLKDEGVQMPKHTGHSEQERDGDQRS